MCLVGHPQDQPPSDMTVKYHRALEWRRCSMLQELRPRRKILVGNHRRESQEALSKL